MNKNLFAAALTGVALLTFGQVASAHDEQERFPGQEYQQNYNPNAEFLETRERRGGHRLDAEVDHLDRMFQHVQAELQRYGAGRHVRYEYFHLRAEFRRLNEQFRRGEQFYNRRRLRAEMQHMHDELHHIEEELHVPQAQFYQWR